MLDTNMLYQEKLLRRAAECGWHLSISTVVYAERLSQLRRDRDLVAARLVLDGLIEDCRLELRPLDGDDACAYAEIAAGIHIDKWKGRAEREKRHDRLIAACAARFKLPLITANVSHFEDVVEVIEANAFADAIGTQRLTNL